MVNDRILENRFAWILFILNAIVLRSSRTVSSEWGVLWQKSIATAWYELKGLWLWENNIFDFFCV